MLVNAQSLIQGCTALACTRMKLIPIMYLQRIRVTIGGKTLVPAKRPDWLNNLCNLSPVLMALKPDCLRQLMSTSRQLRAAVRSFVTTVRFGVNSVQANYQDLDSLSSGNWQNVQMLELNQTLDLSDMYYLTKGQLPQLISLQLRFVDCQYTSEQLARGEWPLLQTLNLSRSFISATVMSRIKHGKWPCLRQLILCDCRLKFQAISHLTDASWQQLELIDLRGNALDGRDMANLSRGTWPSLATLDAGILLEPAAWTHLLTGQWPQLKQLTLAAIWPSVRTDIGLPQPAFHTNGACSDLPALQHCQIYQPQMSQSLAASLVSSWQANLCSLDLANCNVTGTALQPFRQAHWRSLTTLILSYTGVDAAGIGHLVRAKMPVLQNLRLDWCVGMDADAFQQLSASCWPELRYLALQWALLHPRPRALSADALDEASINCVTPLTQAKWPKLETLHLTACTITSKALKTLIKGDWPELKSLGLSYLQLTWSDVGIVRGDSKQEIGLCLNQLQPTKQLAGGLWPKLCWLDLTPD